MHPLRQELVVQLGGGAPLEAQVPLRQTLPEEQAMHCCPPVPHVLADPPPWQTPAESQHPEVNANTVPTGSVEPIPFSPSRDIPFVTEIAEISPEEFSRLERGELALPPGWTLKDADDVPRPRAA